MLTGLVQVMIAAAALAPLAAALRYRRFRVLVTVAAGFAAAAALMAGITYLAGPGGPAPAGLRQGSWLAGAGFPDPAVLAGLAAVAVAAAPWLSPPGAGGLGHAAADRRGPAGHLLAAGTAGLAVLAVPAAPGINVTADPRLSVPGAPARVPVVPAARRRLSGGASPAEAGPRLRARASNPFLLDSHGT